MESNQCHGSYRLCSLSTACTGRCQSQAMHKCHNDFQLRTVSLVSPGGKPPLQEAFTTDPAHCMNKLFASSNLQNIDCLQGSSHRNVSQRPFKSHNKHICPVPMTGRLRTQGWRSQGELQSAVLWVSTHRWRWRWSSRFTSVRCIGIHLILGRRRACRIAANLGIGWLRLLAPSCSQRMDRQRWALAVSFQQP